MKYLVQGPPGLVRRELSGKSATIVAYFGFEMLVDSVEPLVFDHEKIIVTEYVEPVKVATDAERIKALEALLIEKKVFNKTEIDNKIATSIQDVAQLG